MSRLRPVTRPPYPSLGYREKHGTNRAPGARRSGAPALYLVRGRSGPAARQSAEGRAPREMTPSASRFVAASTISPSTRARAVRRREDAPRPLDLLRRRREDGVHRRDLSAGGSPICRRSRARAPARPTARRPAASSSAAYGPSTGWSAEGACRDGDACERVLRRAGADRQHGHADRGGEVARAEDERLERRAGAAIRSTSTSPRAVSICTSRPTPGGRSAATAATSSADSTFGTTTTSGVRARAPRDRRATTASRRR